MIKSILLSGIMLIFAPWTVLADSTVSVSRGNVVIPCMISSDTLNKTSDFGNLQRRNLQTAGDGSVWQDFNLILTDCPAGTMKVKATFSGTADLVDTTAWKNIGTSGNMALRITNSDHTIIYSTGDSLTEVVNVSTRSVIFPLSAKIFTPEGNATTGTFRSTITVEFTWQ